MIGRAERLIQTSAPSPTEIFALIEDRLREVEATFRDSLSSPIGIVDEIGDFVANAGGKRVRPTLHLLTSRLCGYKGPYDVVLGTVLEFIHSATLIHDDIIDDATVRRGSPSVNFRWGNNVTVLFGDYLYAKAMQMALRAGSLQVMETLAQVTLRMIEGELLQTRYSGRVDLSEPEYLDLIERKTAELFACCCELAGLLAEVDEERLAALRAYGLNIGMAFQLVDDLLDYTGNAKQLGKASTADLREGKVTLCVIDLLAQGRLADRELVRRIVDGEADDGPAIARLQERLRESGALARTHARASRDAETARAELRRFPDRPARRALEALPDLLLARRR